MPEVRPEYLEGKKVGVIAGTSHEAYLKAMFTDAEIKSYANDDALRLALRRSEVDFIFGDAISLAFWVNGTDSGECCAFSGGPFVESRYFGEGVGIAVRKGNDLLRTVAELGAVPALGKRPLHRSVAAVFFRQPVLGALRHSRDGAKHERRAPLHLGMRCRVDAVASPTRNDAPSRHFAFCRGSASFRGPGEPF